MLEIEAATSGSEAGAESARRVWFGGDLSDAWVVEIAESLPDNTLRVDLAGELPEAWPESARGARAVVLHRSLLTAGDVSRLSELRSSGATSPRLVVCFGPLSRYRETQAAASYADAVLPESIAPEVASRRAGIAAGARLEPGRRPAIEVVSDNASLREMLADVCRAGGYRVSTSRTAAPPTRDGPAPIAVWDVPVLECEWSHALERRARFGPVVALLGFADRALVLEARGAGASACLDLPCDIDDLVAVLDRVSRRAVEPDPSILRLEAAHRAPRGPRIVRAARRPTELKPRT